jgi:predicted  nucleic acid-binding Zn-ribbon protein
MKATLLLLALVMALAGCTDVESLKSENRHLREQLVDAQKQLENQEGNLAAELAFLHRLASITAACDWLVPLCPESIMKKGHEALNAGYGSNGWEFWLSAFLKFLVLGLLGIRIGGRAWELWLQTLKPAIADIEAAKSLVSSAEGKAQAAQAKADQLAQAIETGTQKLTDLRKQIDTAQQELADLQTHLAERKNALATVENRLAVAAAAAAETKQAAADALSVFNKKKTPPTH